MSADMESAERYLLCRPQGGLNDALVQIEKCWRYAERFGRILLIDPRYSGTLTNLCLFFSPISPSQRVHFHISLDQLQDLNTLTCQPSCVSGRLSEYSSIRILSGDGTTVCCESETRTPLQFDFEVDHPEQLLLHDSWGSGTESFDFLRRVKLESHLALEVGEAIRKLGPDYAAVHVRHSDYRTNWRLFLKTIRTALYGRTVLICSDNVDVLSAGPLILKDSKVVAQAKSLYTDGQPQHRRSGATEHARNETMRAALIDLLKLGAASDLFIATINQGFISGYSRLAAMICQDKTILNSLLGEPLVPSYRVHGEVHTFQIVGNRANQVFDKWMSRFKRLSRRAFSFFFR